MEIEQMKKYKVYGKNGEESAINYRFFLRDEKLDIAEYIEVGEKCMLKRKWLENVPGCYMAAHDDELWKKLKNDVAREAQDCPVDEALRFENIGWHYLKNRWVFAFSNLIIDADGSKRDSFSVLPAFNLPLKHALDKNNQRLACNRLFKVLELNPSILYPIFLTNIGAVFNEVLRKYDLAPGVALWIQGKPGSGKTELALAAGCYVETNGGKKQSLLTMANRSSEEVMQRIRCFSGLNFLLDDVKKERVPGQLSKVRRNVDSCVRSVFLQEVTDSFQKKDEWVMKENGISCGLIVTGELLDEMDSLISRMVYFPVSDYINTEAGGQAISLLQEHPDILAEVMAGFIWYVCNKMEEDSEFLKKCARNIKQNWHGLQIHFVGTNRSRMARTLAMLNFCNQQILSYRSWLGIRETFIDQKFFENMELLNRTLMKRTEALLDSGKSIVFDAIKTVVDGLCIKVAENCDIGDYDTIIASMGYILEADGDGIFIPAPHHFLKKDIPVESMLLIKKENFLGKVKEEIMSNAKKLSWDEYIALNMTVPKLRDMEIVLAEKRSDKAYNNQISFPMVNSYGEVEECECLVMNQEHFVLKHLMQVLKNRAEDMENIEYDSRYARRSIVIRCQEEEKRIKSLLIRIREKFRVVKEQGEK